MREQLPREPQILQLPEHELNDLVRLKCQFAPVAGMGRLALSTLGDHSQSGIFTYNMRTKSERLHGLAAYAERSRSVLRTALMHELRNAGFDLLYPQGYPEVADITGHLTDGSFVNMAALKLGKYYMYAGVDSRSEGDFRVFQFDGFALGRDAAGIPFTNVLYRKDGLRNRLDMVQYGSDDIAEPKKYTVYDDHTNNLVHRRCAVQVYGDDALPYFTAEHFRNMSTDQRFYPFDNYDDVLTIANVTEPEWPPVALPGT